MIGEKDWDRRARTKDQTAAEDDDSNQAPSTNAAGDVHGEQVPDRAEAEDAGAAIGEAVDIQPMEGEVLVENST